jgi:uncharacterized membrane protein
MDMSPQAGTSRRSPQLMLGWIALAIFVVGVGLHFLWEMVGFAFVGLGAVALFVALALELRTRRHVEQVGPEAFPEGGTFGGRRSPQTHTKM